jgi:hypothetical protein
MDLIIGRDYVRLPDEKRGSLSQAVHPQRRVIEHDTESRVYLALPEYPVTKMGSLCLAFAQVCNHIRTQRQGGGRSMVGEKRK